ncbi:MAG: S46 family peptidase [Bacteroidales bacterium]|nr:S46 family peptidase [Bacteroidales bacterium]MCF8455485.1 S46 family peptidase [Bacteroidales bacterium]
MKTKILILCLVLAAGSIQHLKADEGMWLPLLVNRLNYIDMQKMGLKLTPEEIYSVNHSSIKDAIVLMDNRATGTVISPDGLIMTSHNFALEYLQANSTGKEDYLKDGFWATKRTGELPNSGISVSFLISMEDVTKKVLAKVKSDMSEIERQEKIAEAISKLEKKAITKSHFTAKVKPFFEGNEYYLFVYESYPDVRLVGAPPMSVGRFGGDSDNWQWPRHTADFALFRVYTGLDGLPADYSLSNIPMKSKKVLPISTQGIKEGDFAMIMGFPISTSRYIPSYGVELALDVVNPAIIEMKSKILEVIRHDINTNEEIAMKYATREANLSNMLKYYVGQTRQLQRFRCLENKQQLEKDFQQWCLADPARKTKYGKVLSDLEGAYQKIATYQVFNTYYDEILHNGSEAAVMANNFYPLYLEMKTLNPKEEYTIPSSLKEKVRDMARTVNPATDKEVFSTICKLISQNLPKEQHPDIFALIKMDYSDKFDWFANDVYRQSIFCNIDLLWYFVNNPDPKVLENDLVFRIILSCHKLHDQIENDLAPARLMLERSMRLYVEGMQEMSVNKSFYPDANSTMRLSYGQVAGYAPMDGLVAKPYSNYKGIFEKFDPANPDYAYPEKLKELLKNEEFGKYGNAQSMNICFITNNDVTGGCSGSPVLNGSGQIVGFTFDKNWESMSGDIIFESDYQRTINVDVRYILFIIDRFAGAGYLLEEMIVI